MGGAWDKLERAATWEESREVTSSTTLTSWVGLGSSWKGGDVGGVAGGDVVDNLDVMGGAWVMRRAGLVLEWSLLTGVTLSLRSLR